MRNTLNLILFAVGEWTAYALSRGGLHYHDLIGGDSIFSPAEKAGIEGGTGETTAGEEVRERYNFNPDWLMEVDDVPGAERTDFADGDRAGYERRIVEVEFKEERNK